MIGGNDRVEIFDSSAWLRSERFHRYAIAIAVVYSTVCDAGVMALMLSQTDVDIDV